MSRPLHELASQAPPLSPIFNDYEVMFPFSNDGLEPSFQTALERMRTPGYAEAPNRVAVLIGESALANNIHYIPEETIILLDNQMGMCQYMGAYVDMLRRAPDPFSWYASFCNPEKFSAHIVSRAINALNKQLVHGMVFSNSAHALSPDGGNRYLESHKAAKEKAIIPWHADITSDKDMAVLGGTLRANNAKVTLLNLSNVIPFTAAGGEGFTDSAQYAQTLGHLPTTPEMPILTTSRDVNGMLLKPTGPFSGLKDLAENGGDSLTGPVAVTEDTGTPDAIFITVDGLEF
jgi:hypothetical protein